MNLLFTSTGERQATGEYSWDALLRSTDNISEQSLLAYDDWDLSQFTNIFAPLENSAQSHIEPESFTSRILAGPYGAQSVPVDLAQSHPLPTQSHPLEPLPSFASLPPNAGPAGSTRDSAAETFNSPSSPPPINRPLVSLEDIKGELEISEKVGFGNFARLSIAV